MARISTSSSGGNVNIQDTNGNPINSTGGALNVIGDLTISDGFDSLTPGTPTQISVTNASSSTLLEANPNRKYAHIVNNSGQDIYIQYSVAAALNQGIRIPNGALYTLESNNLWLGTINAIGILSNQLIDILEGV